jgi:hypothetical protein
VHAGASLGGYRVEFSAQGEVGRAAGPVDEGDLARQCLEERAQGSDADAAGQKEDFGGGAAPRGEGAVRPLGPDPRAGCQPGQRGAVAACRLHGDAQVAGLRGGGEGVGVGGPP